MARLKLMEAPRRTLEVERPDGRVLNLELRRMSVIEADRFILQIKALEVEHKKGALTAWQYISKQLDGMIVDFHAEDFEDLSYEHITDIAEACKKLLQDKPEGEKKNQ